MAIRPPTIEKAYGSVITFL